VLRENLYSGSGGGDVRQQVMVFESDKFAEHFNLSGVEFYFFFRIIILRVFE
jgi:hypothetical protein